MKEKAQIAFFGSSLVSAYWNGAATYYRGIIRVLNQLGYSITFYEPDAYQRQENRDMADPEWCRVVVYKPTQEALNSCLNEAAAADIVIKASGVGVFDEYLEAEVLRRRSEFQKVLFWDVDAPATLSRMSENPTDAFRKLVPDYDLILTYGGGKPVEEAYKKFGARKCISVYNAFDAETHYPVPPIDEYRCDLAFLGNRLPDREKRVEQFFFKVAEALPEKQFVLGGSGWDDRPLPPNVRYVGHVPTASHNAFNSSAKAVLNISRDSMASVGFSPATRVFEAAGAGACIITDYWKGIDMFFEPGEEILVAENTAEVIEHLQKLDAQNAAEVGRAAKAKALDRHTYSVRGKQLEEIFQSLLIDKKVAV